MRNRDESALEVGTGRHDPGADQGPGGNPRAPFFHGGKTVVHIPDAGDSVHHEERQQRLAAGNGGMDVHVPKPGNQELAGPVDHERLGRDLYFAGPSDRGDPPIADHHGLVAPDVGRFHVDDADVGDDHGTIGLGERVRRQGAGNEQQARVVDSSNSDNVCQIKRDGCISAKPRREAFIVCKEKLRWGQAWFSVFRPIVRSKVVTVRW